MKQLVLLYSVRIAFGEKHREQTQKGISEHWIATAKSHGALE